MERCGITPFRAAYDRDDTQEIVPLAETILFKILAPDHRGLSSGRRLHKGDRVGQRNLVKQVRNKPRLIVETKNGTTEAKNPKTRNPRNVQKHHCCSRFKECPASWRRKDNLAPALPSPPVLLLSFCLLLSLLLSFRPSVLPSEARSRKNERRNVPPCFARLAMCHLARSPQADSCFLHVGACHVSVV